MWFPLVALKSGGPCLAECISGFPAFAENDGMGHLPCTIVTLAHSPSSPLLQSGGEFTLEVQRFKMFIKYLGRCFKSKTFPWSCIEFASECLNVLVIEAIWFRTPGDISPDTSVHIFDGSFLPWAVRFTKVGFNTAGMKLMMLKELSPVIHGKGSLHFRRHIIKLLLQLLDNYG